jgi:adenylosuccinate synthase
MSGKGIVVIGMQYGDEGKGKLVDFLSENADFVVRYQGGANAGHTIKIGDKQVILHQIPSGILRGKKCIMGRGMVINPVTVKEEMKELEDKGFQVKGNLFIDPCAHMVLPEQVDGSKSESGTGRGIAPCYANKAGKKGLRFFDLDVSLQNIHAFDVAARMNLVKYKKFLEEHKDLLEYAQDGSKLLYYAKENNYNILFEGAQGVGLDIDHGQYPEGTSSNPTIGGVMTGSGVSHKFIDMVIGVAKAYVTRVDANGAGPLTTQLDDEVGEKIRDKGGEYGATTGRPRRCGWFDVPLIKYGIRINGIDRIFLTKLDVLSGFNEVKICVGYEKDGEEVGFIPDAIKLRNVKPIYESMPGWEQEITGCRIFEELPENAKRYVNRLMTLLGVPLDISVGPERNQTIMKDSYWN